MDYCLGVSYLGECSNYVNYELSVFNIGVFMAVIGVFFAGFQLINSIHKIRFKARYHWYIIIILFIPLLSVIIGTLLPFIPGKPLPFLGYSIFWEIFTAIYIIVIGLLFIPNIFFKKIDKFDNKNGKLNKIFVGYIARNKNIENLVDELGYFFPDFLKHYKEEVRNKEWGYAHQFITIIQNQRFIDGVINNPHTIQNILLSYTNDTRNSFNYEEQNFLGKIILDSFSNDNSFLVHELNGNFNIDYRNQNGIILKNIIENLDLLGKLNILGKHNTFSYSSNPIFAKNCLKFTNKIIEEFLNKKKIGKNYLKNNLLYNIFETQAEIIEQSFDKIDFLSKSSLLGFNFQYNLSELNQELLNLYGGKKFPEIILNQKKPYGGKYNYHDSNNNIIDAFAFGLFRLMQAFSRFKDKDIRHYTLEYTNILHNSLIFEEIEKRLLILFNQEIRKNLTGTYAMISRVFWENYSWKILNKTEDIEKNIQIIDILKIYAEQLPKLLEGYIYSYTKETLKDPYKKAKAIEKAKKILEDLFPKYISYDKKKNILNIYGWDNLSFSQLDLGEVLKSGKIKIEGD